MNLSTHDLNVFLEIAASKNLSRAAERLAISQPALSMALRRIEDYFGVTLFLRTRRGLELTKAAVKLTEEAKKTLRDLESLKEKVLKQTRDLEGLYTIGFHPQVAAYSYPKFSKSLMTKSPNLNVKLVYDTSRRILSEVVAFNIDFGIVVNPLPHPELTIVKLYRDSIYFWSQNKSSSLQDLNNPLGTLFYDQNLPQMQDLVSKAKKENNISLRRAIHCPDLDVVREFVSHGLGVGVLPATIALKRSQDKLKPIPYLPHFDEQICLIYRRDIQKSEASKFIKNLIIKACQKV